VRLAFDQDGWADYTYWAETDRKMVKRINKLIRDALRDPAKGIGKPEMLKHALAGVYSRRITDEHRLVYLVDGEHLVILQARYHYDDR
jgi:toxin YoeB